MENIKVVISICASFISGFLSCYAFIGYNLNIGGGYLPGDKEARETFLGVIVVSLLIFILTLVWSKKYLSCISLFLLSSLLCVFFISL